jgi:predicted TIM-barrel fold metal-dependent hydrolase
MHAGGPFVAETIELMTRYPSVYADLGRLNWTSPRDVFHGRLRALMQAGLGRRLMFGSDVNLALDGVRLAIQGIQSATFLSASEKRDIFFCNAVRFFKFSELGCL